MPSFANPLKRPADDDEAPWSARKRPSLAPGHEEYWMVTWRNPQTKKHKTWEGDAVLARDVKKAILYDIDGRQISLGSIEGALEEGREYSVGGKEIELDRTITKADFTSGRCFGNGLGGSTPATAASAVRTKSNFVPPMRKLPVQNAEKKGIPLQPVDLASRVNTPSAATTVEQTSAKAVPPTYWTANWRKQQSKAHKTWDGDAFVSHIDGKLTMINEDGKVMGFTVLRGQQPHSGFQMYIGGKEVELDCQIPQSQFPGPRCEGGNEDLKPEPEPEPTKTTINTKSFYGISKPRPAGPLHNPDAEGAVIMKAPTEDHIKKHNTKDRPIVPVVLDPILARKMRDHQREGVKFLYESVMGLRKHEGQGCILADEMGLGKTLQTIALVWTLLKQNPYSGVGPVIKKVMIVCPVSLVNNWKSEFYKWLGRDRMGIATCSKDPVELHAFKNSPTHQVLVIGYERLRSMVNKSEKLRCFPQIDLIICDEGHRLKSSQNKTTKMFKDFKTRRRIILSGTPIQNDLSELHAMTEFCNPGLFDDYPTFRRVYEIPILKSRAPGASAKEVELGDARTTQLLRIAKSFVLRRDADLLKNYLPPKHEYVVFITPTPLQLEIFRKILNPDKMDDLIEQSTTAESLAMIGVLTKISNSPILLRATAENAKGKPSSMFHKRNFTDATSLVPENAHIEDMKLSGKLIALSKMLEVIRETTEEKCVLVSHYTSTLNILEAFCRKMRYSYFRLDGQTPQAQRQEYVNAFNKSNQRGGFIFLLSSKAGGVGINLIGASRLCLIDSDWNPSHDLQSMARCHRDGQKRPVFIYRFLTAGAIDEKIYQRQVTKLALSDSLIGSATNASKSDTFTRKDLRDIFRVHTDTPSNTHDLLDCPCDEGRSSDDASTSGRENISDGQDDAGESDDENFKGGFVNATQVTPNYLGKLDKAYLEKKKAGLAALEEWKHVNCLADAAKDLIQDAILRELLYTDGTQDPSNSRRSNGQTGNLLAAIDLDQIRADVTIKSVGEVPGGTITFVFEKTVNKPLESE
ncbi:RAD54B protein [Macrolepiota fuliginosa MF-IS2]|uniref:RAD54B protein n=1 Tax=Macrolepiota fuliginosa MF-IS2 TaxID=1400762 RepID=A0A9P5XH38_9AGAR|nr:RAD54B protein [Macrolepiota fuliginosa MF-IS2]